MPGKLTQNRQAVLNVLAKSVTALSAYDILDHLHRRDNKWKPATVYRALNYLIEANLVHRIESQQKFISCGHAHREEERHFLICDVCGSVEERLLRPSERSFFQTLAAESQFNLRAPYLEFRGTCHQCADAA